MKRFIGVILAYFFVCAAAQAEFAAQENTDVVTSADLVEVNQWQFSLAAGLGIKTNPIIDGDNLPLILIPSVKYYGEEFHFDNGDFGYSLIEQQHFSVGLLATLNEEFVNFSVSHPKNLFGTVDFSTGESIPFSSEQETVTAIDDAEQKYGDFTPAIPNTPTGSNSTENDELGTPEDNFDPENNPRREYQISYANISKRHWSVDGGIQAFWYLSNQQKFRLRLLTDISDRHQGHNIKLSYHGLQSINAHWRLSYQLGFDWLSKELVNYYYGVSAKDNADPSQYYQAKATLLPYVKIGSAYKLTPKWQLVASLKYQPLAKTISNSPLVDKNYRSTAFFGVSYAF